ncbi:alpha/beta family hydrolase [Pleionea sediminis]|uniref:alpha/beta family hydrolase n=1 Tax=Pleionea sediminis TaxID=2569479 RepID=UPI0011869032|nr:alpha/beta family hydrolase [Pleionea sediminis]
MPIIDPFNPRKKHTLLLAHGAGESAQSNFMNQLKELIEQFGIQVLRLNFLYMEKALKENKRRPPDRIPKLIEEFRNQIDTLNKKPIWIGGKSMGGRVATMCNDHNNVTGCIGFGYPFHPPGKPENLRTEHLTKIAKPCLILQGERDTFGTISEISEYQLSKKIHIESIIDGDHSFKPRKRSGLTQEENLKYAAQKAAEFIKKNT